MADCAGYLSSLGDCHASVVIGYEGPVHGSAGKLRSFEVDPVACLAVGVVGLEERTVVPVPVRTVDVVEPMRPVQGQGRAIGVTDAALDYGPGVWPWICVATRLSLTFAVPVGHSAWVLPWQAWHATPL